MRKLFYMGLEQYEARYSLQLTSWNTEVFDRRGIDYHIVTGDELTTDKQIVTGSVLDAHGRTYFSLMQTANLVKLMKEGEITSEDVIFYEDMFTPGIESLGYILDQVSPEYRPRIFVRCLAQSVDPDDFVHVTGMAPWMSLYEQMVNEIVKKSGGAILATNEEMVAHMKIAGWSADIYNISGLAFGKEEVQGRIGGPGCIRPFDSRKNRVVFAARWDQEKQPDFYMDLIEHWYSHNMNNVEFCLLQGGPLRSNDQKYIDRARKMAKEGRLVILENLKKNEYYNLLNDSRVLFNSALQDWVSNTVSEADSLGCNVLYPAYRSFPETFANDHERLYVPWSIEDAVSKLEKLLLEPHRNMGLISGWNNGTIDRCINIMSGVGKEWLRTTPDYRNHTSSKKYAYKY